MKDLAPQFTQQVTQLADLAAERLGGKVLACNDEFFAPKENLLKESKPVFIEGKYTARGKWMDGWETRRRRTPGHDWCIVRLGLPGMIRGIVVDTSFFTGNFPEQFSLEACDLGSAPYKH
jgi:allantoicase